MPKKLLLNEISLKVHQFKETMARRSYMVMVLKNVGFDDESLTKVMNGEIIKDKDILSAMEKLYEENKAKGG